MTVKKLIEKLQEFDEDMKVVRRQIGVVCYEEW